MNERPRHTENGKGGRGQREDAGRANTSQLVPAPMMGAVCGTHEDQGICRVAHLLALGLQKAGTPSDQSRAKGYASTHTGRVSGRYEKRTIRRGSRGREKRQAWRRRPRSGQGCGRGAPGAHSGREPGGESRGNTGTESRGEPRGDSARTPGEATGGASRGSAAGRSAGSRRGSAGTRRRSPKVLNRRGRRRLPWAGTPRRIPRPGRYRNRSL